MRHAILLAIIAAPSLSAAEPPPKSPVSPWVPAVGAPQYFLFRVNWKENLRRLGKAAP